MRILEINFTKTYKTPMCPKQVCDVRWVSDYSCEAPLEFPRFPDSEPMGCTNVTLVEAQEAEEECQKHKGRGALEPWSTLGFP